MLQWLLFIVTTTEFVIDVDACAVDEMTSIVAWYGRCIGSMWQSTLVIFIRDLPSPPHAILASTQNICAPHISIPTERMR